MLGIVVSAALEINHNKVSSHYIVIGLLELAQAAVEVLLDVARGIKLVWRGLMSQRGQINRVAVFYCGILWVVKAVA